MAFNPFDVFRRNQKILFAILTVIVMFMFVLSSGVGGRGDFFDWLPRWLGSKKRSGEVLAVVNGSKVYQSEVYRIQQRRILANQYMSEAGIRASQGLAKYVTENLSRASKDAQPIVQQALQIHQFLPMVLSRGPLTPEMAAQLEPILGLSMVQNGLQGIVTAKSPKETDLDIARATQSMLALDFQLASSQRGLYFTTVPNQSNRDVLEFYLWTKKADALGIEINSKDLDLLVTKEFRDQVKDDDWKMIRENMKTKAGFSMDTLREALVDEFRVRAAQSVVLGQSAIKPGSREFEAPYDYYQFFREQCSTSRYGVITVPAENYLDKVTGSPTEAELREIFNKYRSKEPNPALPDPGLKEPRKVKLEWLEVTGNEPYYKAAANEGMQKIEAMTKAGGFLFAPLGGPSIASVLAAVAPAAITDLPLQTAYQDYRRQQEASIRDNWYSNPLFGAPKPLDSSVLQAQNLAAFTGVLGGSLAGGSSLMTPATFVVGETFIADRKARIAALSPALMAPVGPGTAALGTPLAIVGAEVTSAQPLPLATVRGVIVEKVKEELARTIANNDLTKFTEDLTKLGAKPDKAEARAAIDKFVKDRGLKQGASTEFRDLFNLSDDPGLKPLKTRKDETDPFHTGAGFTNPIVFGQRFFTTMDPQTRQLSPSTVLYAPQPYPQMSLFRAPSPTESIFMVWRTADQPAEVMRDFNAPDVRAKATAAWRMQKARELARKAADDLAKQCGDLGKSFVEIEQKLRDKRAQFAGSFTAPTAQERVKYFEIDDVAALMTRPLPGAMPRASVAPFQMAPSSNVPYPGPKMTEELLANRDKAPSTAFVMTDNPETTFYTTVLLGRDEKSADEFGLLVYGPGSSFSEIGPAVARRQQEELRKKEYETALALLKAEFRYEKENEIVNKKTDDTSGD